MSAARDQFLAVVTENVPLCREHFRLELRAEGFPATRAGQFVQLLCRPVDADEAVDREADWAPDRSPRMADPELRAPQAVLRRPFSLAGRSDAGGGAPILQVIHRVVGIGTAWLAALRPGDTVGVLGPLGNTFAPPRPEQAAILVGGGVGIPPMLYLASELASHRGRSVAFCGATTRDLLPLTATGDAPADAAPAPVIGEFARHGIPSVVTTDDGSLGFRGFVTQALERYLEVNAVRGDTAVIYTCGPEAMMKRVADIAIARDIPCQVAVERAMACGMGTCQSCCIRVRKPDQSKPPLVGRDWCYRLACTDGPIFAARDLLW